MHCTCLYILYMKNNRNSYGNEWIVLCAVCVYRWCAAIVVAELLSFYLVALAQNDPLFLYFYFISLLVSHLAVTKVLQTKSIDLCCVVSDTAIHWAKNKSIAVTSAERKNCLYDEIVSFDMVDAQRPDGCRIDFYTYDEIQFKQHNERNVCCCNIFFWRYN